MRSPACALLASAWIAWSPCCVAWTKAQTKVEQDDWDQSPRLDRIAEIRHLVADLGSERYATREDAERRLAELGPVARSELERAAQLPDAEVVARARRLLARLPEPTHTLVDALDAPIPWATGTVTVFKPTGEEDSEYESVRCESDELGRIAVPPLPTSTHKAVIDIDHPRYGRGRYELSTHARETNLRLPLVSARTEARRRAVEGVVRGPDGRPVEGAVVRCRNVRTPGEGLINGDHPYGEAVTDADGRFSFYLPNENRERERGDLIPTNSRYHLTIRVPRDESFFPAEGVFSNRRVHSIPLQRATRFHRFRFLDADGRRLDEPDLLQSIRIFYARDGKDRVPLGPEVVTEGRRLIPGKYLATGFVEGARVAFEPVVVTDDTPQEIVFRLPPAVAFRGRVVNGVTGEPIVRAFVIGWASTSRNNLAVLSADDWSQLRSLASNPSLDHPAIKLLQEHYGVQGLVRTDNNGRFEIAQAPEEHFYGVMAFDEDFVPYTVRVYSLGTDRKGPIDAGEFPLFPAAKVLVRPVHEGQRISVSPKWLPTDAGQPAWFGRFRARMDDRGRELKYVHWLRMNEAQPIYVPSGVRLRLKFETPYHDQWAPAVVDTPIQLQQGAVHDIGEIHFQAALPAIVRVLGSDGQPVEGIPVRRKYDDGDAWCVAHNTDASGQAYFHVNPRSQGQFRVSDIPGPREVARAENLFADFEVSDTMPPRPFEITITDEQRRLLLETSAEGQEQNAR